MIRYLARYQFTNWLHSAALILMMLAILSVIGWLIAGEVGLAWALGMGVLLTVFTPALSPRLILGLYQARPVPPEWAPELHEINRELARRAHLPAIPGLYYVPSQVMNSFATGRPGEAAVALSDGLLRELNGREIAAILAHEISHIRHRDLWVMGLADVIGRLTSALALAGYFLVLFYLPLSLAGEATIPWGLLLVFVLAPNLSALLQLALARTREYRADIGAVELTDDPLGLAQALQKIEQYHAHWLHRVLMPHRKNHVPSLLRTHPATEERIKRLMRMAREEGADFGWPDSIDAPGDSPPPPRHRFHGFWY